MNMTDVAIQSDPKTVELPRGLVRTLMEMVDADSIVPHQAALIEHVRAEIGDVQAADDRKWLAQYLHYDGEKRTALDYRVIRAAFALCDGYGKMTADELEERELMWDWSHVRDSSNEALAAARAYIGGILA